MVRSTLCERKSLVSLWLEIQHSWADIGILPCIQKFSSCVKDDLILLVELMVYFSQRISSLNFVAGSDLEIENFWPDWVLWKIAKNQFSPIFNLSPYLWTGSIRDQYSYDFRVSIHGAKHSLLEKILGGPSAGFWHPVSWHWSWHLPVKFLEAHKNWCEFTDSVPRSILAKNLQS